MSGMGARVNHLRLAPPLLMIGAVFGACGGAPERASSAPPLPPAFVASAPSAVRPQAPTFDDCETQPGQPPPEPLVRAYTGVAAKARCQREVYTIMGDVTQALGVKCDYCHLVPDYAAMTRRKEIANWMASELIPSLQKHDGAPPWCEDCHTVNGKAVAKILGEPRRTSWAVEWMTTRLVADFETGHGAALQCKSCHEANLGATDFQRRVILTHHLPPN